MRPDLLPGMSDESDECEFVVPPPGSRRTAIDAGFREFAADLRRLRDEGLEVQAPTTPTAAFGGQPPPPLSRNHHRSSGDAMRVHLPDFDDNYPLFARIIAIDDANAADTTAAHAPTVVEIDVGQRCGPQRRLRPAPSLCSEATCQRWGYF